ncbi:(2Fe-2S)-binding protein [Streptomyces thermocarboxydus]|uniref:(2Fe-2S)-binding protein n=1 Tax=Streptomyces thermocarboxydus TaxID=59299 RepID=UPI0025C9AB45|nr:(2Fe-2S)-binding protein [Streptomyces thermocarboxydus]
MVLLYVVDLDPRLTALRALGGFFVLRAGEDADRHLPTLDQAYGPRRPGVQHTPATDPLTVRVRRVAAALRTQEPRVAASVAHQGLAARLWSVALGCAALHGAVPDLAPSTLRWDPEGSAPDDLHLPEVRPLPGDAATLADVVLRGHLEPLSAALRARHRIAPALLRGNAASALAAAAREITRHARPDTAARATRLAGDLLDHPLLTGAGTLTGSAFRRRSCCLYYRVPDGGVCGDCCFVRPPRSSPRAPTA